MTDGRVLIAGGGVEGLAQLELVEAGGKAERHVLARAAEEIGKHAEAFFVAGNVVEQRAGRGLAVLQKLGGKPDIGLPAGAGDMPHLAERIGLLDPFAQIAVGDGMFEITGLRFAHDGVAHAIVAHDGAPETVPETCEGYLACAAL